MKIEGTPEEIAAFVVAVQGKRQTVDEIGDELANRLTAAFQGMPIGGAGGINEEAGRPD